MDTDVIIVGAGPIGSIAASQIAKSKFEVILVDQRKIIGNPDHCAGLLSKTGLRKLGLETLPPSIIQNPDIRGAKFFSPLNKTFTVERKNNQAIVVDRTLFDQYLVQNAQDNGAELITERKITKVSFQKNNHQVEFEYSSKKTKQQNYMNSSLGIIAEGGRGFLTKQILPHAVSNSSRLSGYQLLIEGIKDLDKNYVELYANNQISPGFFTWIIPISDTSAKVGLASREKMSVSRLQYFLKKYHNNNYRFNNSKVIKKFGGEVIVNGLLRKTHSKGFMIIGDAAGQTKSTTGGGVITGGIAASIAANVAIDFLKENKNNYNILQKYDVEWKKMLKKQFKAMALFRWLLDRISNNGLDIAFQTVIENNLMALIEEKADIDSQADIIFSLLKNPAVIKLAFRLLPELKL
ncbi:MAG: geranylgeranyl reductase family protein [Candidatus Thorarchaeota archaeon]